MATGKGLFKGHNNVNEKCIYFPFVEDSEYFIALT